MVAEKYGWKRLKGFKNKKRKKKKKKTIKARKSSDVVILVQDSEISHKVYQFSITEYRACVNRYSKL